MTRALALLLLPLVAVAAPSTPPAKGEAKAEAPLPKPAPRDGDGSEKANVSKLPAFFGLFGPAALVAKTGFRSAPGRYIEFQLLGKSGTSTEDTAMRIAEVGPPLQGKRWFEVTASAGVDANAGMRILTRGEKDGNVERIIAAMPQFPTMEFPLDSASLTKEHGGISTPIGGADVVIGPPKKVGHETVKVPLGTFECDHWVVEAEGEKAEYWVTTDPKIPFNGAVKMISGDGTAVAKAVGTDAVARIVVPAKAE